MLEWLDATALSTWLKESPSVWAFPTVLTLHTTGMGILVGASYVLDLRLLGIGRNVPLSGYRWVFPTLAVGLGVNIFTGILLFIKDPVHWGTAFPFFIKMTPSTTESWKISKFNTPYTASQWISKPTASIPPSRRKTESL